MAHRYLRHLLAPLALAAMLLGLSSNANAQSAPGYSTFPPAQVFTVGTAVNLTLPAATGGDAPVTYTLSPTVPGLTLNPNTRVLSGTPTTAAALASHTLRATDVDDEDGTTTFDITVEAAQAQPLAFPTVSGIGHLPDFGNIVLYYPVGVEITPTTFPAASGGTAPITYTFGGAPNGLTFDAATRVLTGTAVVPTAAARIYYTATDSASPPDTVRVRVSLSVCAADGGGFPAGDMFCIPPAYATLALTAPPGPDRTFVVNQQITPVTLPAATGGTSHSTAERPTEIYSISPLPAGLTFDAATRVLTGTPPAIGTSTLTYEVRDAGSPPSLNRFATTTFAISVTANADTAPAFANDALILRQFYNQQTMITPLTFPEATGGNGPLTYTLTGSIGLVPGLPAGLTFDGTARPPTLTGTPNIRMDDFNFGIFTYRVTDGDGNIAETDSDTLEVDITVSMPQPALDFSPMIGIGAEPSGDSVVLYYPLGRPITPTTFPAPISGTAPYTYGASGALSPLGLYFDLSTRFVRGVLTGTPTTAGVVQFGYHARDSATPSATASVLVTIIICETGGVADGGTACPRPAYTTFSFPTPPGPPTDQVFPSDRPITPLTLPEPIGGYSTTNPIYYYEVVSGLPAGLRFDPTNRVIFGTPTMVGTTTVNYRVSHAGDRRTRSLTVSFDIVVMEADATPAFAADTVIPVQRYFVGTTISTLTLPQATGGTAPLTYTLARVSGGSGLPAGLTFDAAARPPTITGTPTEQTGAPTGVAFAYTVTDGDGNTAASDSDTLFFTLEVSNTGQSDLAFPRTTGLGATPNSGNITLYYRSGQPITPVTFPAATGGTTPYTYSMGTGTLPGGLTFDASVRVLSGTPNVAGVSRFVYVVTDSAAPSNVDNVQTQITICDRGISSDGPIACPAPTFVTLDLPTPAAQAFITGATITPVTLPAATGGTGINPVRIYTAMPLPLGLTFDPTNRAITGTPTTVGSTTVNYRVGDAGAGNADTQSTTVTFDIVVRAPATGFTVSVVDRDNEFVVPAVTEGQSGNFRVVATPTPAGSAFAAAQQVTFEVAPPLLAPPDSASDPYVAYTAVAPGTIPLAVGAASVTFDFTIATTDDALDHADFPVTITATASPSGATGTTTALTLLDNDISITTTPAAATVVEGATATYDVQLSEATARRHHRHGGESRHRHGHRVARHADLHHRRLEHRANRHRHRRERGQHDHPPYRAHRQWLRLCDQRCGGYGHRRHRPGLRRWREHRRPELHRGPGDYAADPAARHRRQRRHHLHPDPCPARRPDL